jgi:hypothetical protein
MARAPAGQRIGGGLIHGDLEAAPINGALTRPLSALSLAQHTGPHDRRRRRPESVPRLTRPDDRRSSAFQFRGHHDPDPYILMVDLIHGHGAHFDGRPMFPDDPSPGSDGPANSHCACAFC